MKDFLSEFRLGIIMFIVMTLLIAFIMWLIKDNRIFEIMMCSAASYWLGIIYGAIDEKRKK